MPTQSDDGPQFLYDCTNPLFSLFAPGPMEHEPSKSIARMAPPKSERCPELFRLPKEPLRGSITAVFAVLLCHDCHKVLVAQLARVLLNTYLCERTVQISVQIEEKPCDNLCLLGAKDREKGKRDGRPETGRVFLHVSGVAT